MWDMAEHWRNTRDRAWMEKAAPKLVASCDWVTRERKGAMMLNPDGTQAHRVRLAARPARSRM